MSGKSTFTLFMESNQAWDKISTYSVIIAIIMLIISPYFSFPFGKTYDPKRARIKIDIPDRVALINSNFWGPLIFLLNRPNQISAPAILYISHYIHRVIIYPWFRSSFSRPWPLVSVLYYTSVNILNGLSITRLLTYQIEHHSIIIQIVFSILFLGSDFITAYFDYQLCHLRTAGFFGYRIPSGPFFNFISSPNYTCEIFQWIFFFFLLPRCKLSIAFTLWHIANLLGRGFAVQRAYNKLFQSKYPDNRAALFAIPYRINKQLHKTI